MVWNLEMKGTTTNQIRSIQGVQVPTLFEEKAAHIQMKNVKKEFLANKRTATNYLLKKDRPWEQSSSLWKEREKIK